MRRNDSPDAGLGTSGIVPRVGCVFRPDVPPESLAKVARVADESGIDELWLWEDCFAHGGIATAAIALSNSVDLTVGVGVLPIPMRNVALTAMEMATLERAFPGRVRIGVGHGVQDWMRQIGAKVASPLTYLREYLTCLAALLRGENVTYAGRYVSLRDVRLAWPPSQDMELLAAATGPKTLQLSGELASGTILTGGTTPDETRDAVAHIRAGLQAGVDRGCHSVLAHVICTTGPNARAEAMQEIEHWELDPERAAVASGTPKEIADSCRQWVLAGADTVILQPAATVNLESFVGIVGNDLLPLIKG